MINSGYFTSRHEILEWLNSLLKLPITKIEQLGSGNIYCQLIDAAYPNKIPLAKVKWQATLEVDFLHNFRILQTAFERLGINRTIETQRLAKAKYQDNLEFVQWMKWHLSPLIANNPNYDAPARRGNAHVHLLFTANEPPKRDQKEKENLYRSVGTGLTSYRSVQQLKPIQRTLEKGQSMRRLLASEKKELNQKANFKKSKKNTLEPTLKPLQERKVVNVPVIESEDEECF